MEPITTASILALAIVFARHEMRMSQQDLANAMGGIDKQRISNIESGNENITTQYLDTIIAALNITHHRFLEHQFEALTTLLQNLHQSQTPHN